MTEAKTMFTYDVKLRASVRVWVIGGYADHATRQALAERTLTKKLETLAIGTVFTDVLDHCSVVVRLDEGCSADRPKLIEHDGDET